MSAAPIIAEISAFIQTEMANPTAFEENLHTNTLQVLPRLRLTKLYLILSSFSHDRLQISQIVKYMKVIYYFILLFNNSHGLSICLWLSENFYSLLTRYNNLSKLKCASNVIKKVTFLAHVLQQVLKCFNTCSESCINN